MPVPVHPGMECGGAAAGASSGDDGGPPAGAGVVPACRVIDPDRVDAAAPEIARLDALARHHDPRHAGRRVRWRQWGAGAPVILIHGGHGSWLHWLRTIEPLAGRYTVWVPDLPSYGDSEDLAGPRHAGDRQGQLVRALLSTWRQLPQAGQPVSLVGFSFGGLVGGQLIAAGLPTRRLALLGTAAHRTPRRTMSPLVNWRFVERPRSLAILEHNLHALMLHDRSRFDGLALLAHERASRATRYRSKDLAQAVDLGEILSGYDGDLRMIWGEWDVTAADPAQAARRITRHRADADWHVIDGAGHWVQYEAPTATLALLYDWLGWRP